MLGWSLNDGSVAQGLTVDQSAAAPGAGATVASISLGNGEYTVEWTLELTGTIGAADVDNVQVFIGATLVGTSVNTGVVGDTGQEEIPVSVSGGPLTLAFKAIGAGTVGSTYKIEANIIPSGNSLGTINDGGQPLVYIGVSPGNVQTVYTGSDGIAVDTELKVQATQGTLAGTLWYALPEDYYAHGDADHYTGG